MMTITILIGIAVCLFLVERLWPANQLPKVRGWWARVALVNLAQVGVVVLAGQTWDVWMRGWSLLRLSEALGDFPAAGIAYLVSCFIYYGWHRIRHESEWFWRLCHQLHHSPRRIELVTSFYKHPVEIIINSVLSSLIVYPLLGCSVRAAAIYTFVIAVAEYFYHWNVRTPRWIGWLVQRPESHRVHHEYQRHTRNYADLPLIDWLFGTLENPTRTVRRCGFSPEREARLADMLVFRDVHDDAADRSRAKAKSALAGPAPTCIGCRKRWACHAAPEAVDAAAEGCET